MEIQSSLESIDAVRKKLSITVAAETVTGEFDKAYRGVRRKVAVPGFRKGHVPLQMVKQLYAEEVKSEVAQEVISSAWHQAVKEAGVTPVSDPEIGAFDLAEGQPLSFTAEFEVRPEIVLPEYKGLDLVRKVEEVTEEDVDRVLADLREQQAMVRPVTEERPVREGDIAVMDFDGHVDGKPMPGAKGEGYPLLIGSKTFVPGFEDQVAGMRAGESKQFILTLPGDFRPEELAGKDAQFSVTLRGLKERILPELDEEFARGYKQESLEALRAHVAGRLAGERERQARAALKQSAVEKLLAAVDFVAPPSLVRGEEESLQRDFVRRLAIRGMPEEEVKKHLESEMPGIRQAAERNVKVSLILDEIANAEEIKMERGELDQAVKDMAQRYQKPVPELRKEMIKSGAMENFYHMLREEKTLDFLVDNSRAAGEKKDAAAKGD